ADPLDIRDMVNWLEPQFELDLDKLKAEVQRRLPQSVAAWNGWAIQLESGAKLQLAHRWDTTDGRNQRYRLEAMANPGGMKLQRRLKIGPQHNYLALSLARYPEGTQPSKVEVLINGEGVAE